MKNYVISFIGKDQQMRVEAQTAAEVVKAWVGGAKVIAINGGVYAAHQISSVAPLDSTSEKDLCEIYGVSKPPRMADFLPKKDNILL